MLQGCFVYGVGRSLMGQAIAETSVVGFTVATAVRKGRAAKIYRDHAVKHLTHLGEQAI